MAYVITERCINCKYTACTQVCPVDCFREGTNSLVIDPDICISCGACEPECPVNAIFEESDVPEKYQEAIALNAELSQKWPEIIEKHDPLPDADKWKDVEDKMQYLEKDQAA